MSRIPGGFTLCGLGRPVAKGVWFIVLHTVWGDGERTTDGSVVRTDHLLEGRPPLYLCCLPAWLAGRGSV